MDHWGSRGGKRNAFFQALFTFLTINYQTMPTPILRNISFLILFRGIWCWQQSYNANCNRIFFWWQNSYSVSDQDNLHESSSLRCCLTGKCFVNFLRKYQVGPARICQIQSVQESKTAIVNLPGLIQKEMLQERLCTFSYSNVQSCFKN